MLPRIEAPVQAAGVPCSGMGAARVDGDRSARSMAHGSRDRLARHDLPQDALRAIEDVQLAKRVLPEGERRLDRAAGAGRELGRAIAEVGRDPALVAEREDLRLAV